MRLPLRALLDPLFQSRDLRRLELLVLLRRRHDVVRISGDDPLVKRAFPRVPLHHRRPAILALAKEPLLPVKTNPLLARRRIRSVAGKAILAHNRTHIAVENHTVIRRPRRQRQHEHRDQDSESLIHHTMNITKEPKCLNSFSGRATGAPSRWRTASSPAKSPRTPPRWRRGLGGGWEGRADH